MLFLLFFSAGLLEWFPRVDLPGERLTPALRINQNLTLFRGTPQSFSMGTSSRKVSVLARSLQSQANKDKG